MVGCTFSFFFFVSRHTCLPLQNSFALSTNLIIMSLNYTFVHAPFPCPSCTDGWTSFVSLLSKLFDHLSWIFSCSRRKPFKT
jgi:hypothetical protein